MGNRINTIMQAAFFTSWPTSSPTEEADPIHEGVAKKTYGKKGDDGRQEELDAIDTRGAPADLKVNVPASWKDGPTRPPALLQPATVRR